MSAAHDSSDRLVRLTQILNGTSAPHVTSTSDAAEMHLRSVRLERIRELAAELDRRGGQTSEPVEGIAIRLLLDEYTAAVAHLRAVVRIAVNLVDSAPAPLKVVRKYVHQQVKRQEKRRDKRALMRTGDAPPSAPTSQSR